MHPDLRKFILKNIIEAIKDGEFNSAFPSLEQLWHHEPPQPARQEYISPVQRDTFNYGYATSADFQSDL